MCPGRSVRASFAFANCPHCLSLCSLSTVWNSQAQTWVRMLVTGALHLPSFLTFECLVLSQMLQRMGSNRPQALVQIDHVLWRGIFDLTFYGGSHEKMLALCNTINSILELTSDSHDEGWFCGDSMPFVTWAPKISPLGFRCYVCQQSIHGGLSWSWWAFRNLSHAQNLTTRF